jgi:hypothetical protein
MHNKPSVQIALWCAVLIVIAGLWSRAATPPAGSSALELAAALQAQTASEEADDEALDESFRRFGRAAGAAYQRAPDADKLRAVDDVRHAYTRIGQLFGSDRAFFFAAAFGNGSDQPFDKARCPELLKRLRESSLVRRLGPAGANK